MESSHTKRPSAPLHLLILFKKLICISEVSKFLFLIISHNNRLLFINAQSDKRLLRLSIFIKCIMQTTCLPELAMVRVDSTGKAVLNYRQCSCMSWFLKPHVIPFYVQRKFPVLVTPYWVTSNDNFLIHRLRQRVFPFLPGAGFS